MPPLPPAAPPARPASLTCSARHRALSWGGSRTLGPCVRVCVPTAWVTQVRVRVLCQGGVAAALPRPPPPHFPPLATELLSEGPAPRRSYFYLFTARASSSLSLPSCPPPTSPVTAFCSGPPRPGWGLGQAQAATGHRLKTPHHVQGCRVDPGWRDRVRAGRWWLVEGMPVGLLRALAAPCSAGVTGGGEEWHPWGVGPAREPCFGPLWSLWDLATWKPMDVLATVPPQSPPLPHPLLLAWRLPAQPLILQPQNKNLLKIPATGLGQETGKGRPAQAAGGHLSQESTVYQTP